MAVTFTIETEQESDGRWIAEVMEIPGVMVYGSTIDEAVTNVQALALSVLAESVGCSGQVRTTHTKYIE